MKANYFNILTPQEWHCNIHEIDEHGKMRIRLFKPYVKEEKLWIVFNSVLYCDLPTLWEGASFDIASSNERLELIRSLREELVKQISDDELIEQYKLFKVQIKQRGLEDKYVKILASNATLELIK